jgi:hypothetical protein
MDSACFSSVQHHAAASAGLSLSIWALPAVRYPVLYGSLPSTPVTLTSARTCISQKLQFPSLNTTPSQTIHITTILCAAAAPVSSLARPGSAPIQLQTLQSAPAPVHGRRSASRKIQLRHGNSLVESSKFRCPCMLRTLLASPFPSPRLLRFLNASFYVFAQVPASECRHGPYYLDHSLAMSRPLNCSCSSVPSSSSSSFSMPSSRFNLHPHPLTLLPVLL